jgi:hypothetical protein
MHVLIVEDEAGISFATRIEKGYTVSSAADMVLLLKKSKSKKL